MACKTFFRSLAVLPIFLLVQCAQDSKTFGEDDLKGFTGSLSGQVLSRKGSPLSAVTVTVWGGAAAAAKRSDAGSAFSVASGWAGFSGPVHDMFRASAAAANKYAYRFMFSVVNRLMPYDVPPDSSVYGP